MAKLKKILNHLSLSFSARGLILLLFFSYLLKSVVIDDADIVASVITYTFLLFLLFSCVGTLLGKHLLKRKLQLLDVSSSSCVTAGQNSVFAFQLPKLFIFPFFQLQADFIFDHPLDEQPKYIISGKSSSTIIPLSITFPHRGLWTIEKIKFSFGDRFGICNTVWEDSDFHKTISVEPPHGYAETLPILSSFFRAGDENLNVTERKGDPYDIKRYHPSDGIRKIIWKLYAKNENLMAREAEASVCSEGQVALFCLARTEDDKAAASTIAYSQRLEHEELDLYASCLGGDIYRTTCELKTALIAHAFDKVEVVQSLEAFIDKVQKSLNNRPLQQLIIFVDSAYFLDENAVQNLVKIANFLESKQIKSAFFVVGQSIKNHTTVKRSKFIKCFFEAEEESPTKSTLNEFLALSNTRNIQIYTEESHA